MQIRLPLGQSRRPEELCTDRQMERAANDKGSPADAIAGAIAFIEHCAELIAN
jgi:hypothetical protein